MPDISVILPTHNPDAGRLKHTLAGLKAQTFPADRWEAVMVDNASSPALETSNYRDTAPANLQVVRENTLGLSAARRCGFLHAKSPFLIMVDDDNVLAPDYLENVMRLFTENPRVGAMGGKSIPEFEGMPEPWMREFDDLLALRDFGNAPQTSGLTRDEKTGRIDYPHCAPVGAGMALRREAIDTWMRQANSLSDRRGNQLSSGGDNDLILHILKNGWEVAYQPTLSLTHLIPANRSRTEYLARLNHGIQDSWMRLLTRHEMNPWPPISEWSVPFRQIKSWFTFRAWHSPAHYVRWRGTCGHFAGRGK